MNVIHYRKPVADEQQRGRPRLYDDEQRKQRHREAALRWYYKRQAAKAPCFFAEMGQKHAASLLSTELSTKDTHVLSHLSQGELANR